MATLLWSLATNILSEENRTTHDDYGDTYIDVEIVGAGSECPCKQGNGGSKQSHLYVSHGSYLLIGLNPFPGTRSMVIRFLIKR